MLEPADDDAWPEDVSMPDERSRRLEGLLEHIPGIVYQIELGEPRRVLLLTNSVEVMLGYEAADFLGPAPRRSLDEIVQPEDRLAVSSARRVAVEREESFAIEYRVLDAAGDVRWVYEQAEVAVRGGGRPPLLDGVIFDINDRKHVEAELARIETELRMAHKLEAIGRLAGGMAHEINTPMQFTIDSVGFLRETFSDLLAAAGEYRASALGAGVEVGEIDERADLEYVQERAPAAFDRALLGLARVTEIVRALKEFAQPEQREFALADVNDALRAALTVAKSELRGLADVETQFSRLPRIECNIADLNQVFFGLLVNAAHAIADGPRARGTVRVSTHVREASVVVEIHDDGCGMTTELSERVFDPFFTTKDVGRGAGQGLTMARAVLENHSGTITFESEPGRGTHVTLLLPTGVIA